MTNRAHDVHVGDRITYLASTPATWRGLCRHGTVVANPISDPYTAVVWIPTQPDESAEDTEPTWVRHDRVVDVASVE
ncbi:hypothetical protein FHU38_002777 [Saccharomonospora amisosensis]|uniref:Uncharacterized protein n=1 Tax=Saccharomonospora amisosensis TaxID=1128677 RepID=A0A7X5URH7_9PSEU|nr:hypothetical protein [Saccharomonospora amisosensis]NIJ12433.1 hypothetical protein [Saccharomonospora amisosensis]